MKKGVKLCSIALLVLSIMFLGLFANSSVVSAKQYNVDSLLIHPIRNLQDFPIISLTSSDGITPRNSSYLNTTYDSVSGKCKNNNSYKNPGYVVSTNYVEWYGAFNNSYLLDRSSPLSLCQSIYAYGGDYSVYTDDLTMLTYQIPDFDDGSIPFSEKLNFDSMLPYNYLYQVMPFSDSRAIEGVVYNDHFDFSELLSSDTEPNDSDFVYHSDIITGFSFPINFDSNAESLNAGTTIEADFTIESGSVILPETYSILNPFFTMGYADGSSSFSSYSFTCTKSSYSPSVLRAHCVVSIPRYHLRGSYGFSFGINDPHLSISLTPFTSSPGSLTVSSISLILNDDDTPGGSSSYDYSGGLPNVAPGKANITSDPNYSSSLTNLFNFNFLNPFAPLFALFSDNSSCGHIPILASMLGATDDTYCPWFPGSVRTILTPVMAFSSSMLLFGFLVRWLGSSSGNFVEDTGTHDFGSYSVRSRFKKGGK